VARTIGVMENLTTTPTTHRPRRAVRRSLGLATLTLTAGLVALTGAVHGAAGSAPGQRLCTWRPVADDVQPTAISLLGTVRLVDGRLEVLHRVTCSDGSAHDQWMADAG
jgi:hypothetical protein